MKSNNDQNSDDFQDPQYEFFDEDRRLSADDHLTAILSAGAHTTQDKNKTFTNKSMWMHAEIRQPVFIRYLEAIEDKSAKEKKIKDPVTVYQGFEAPDQLQPLVYRELLQESENDQHVPVHLEKLSYDEGTCRPQVRPIVIERWIHKHPLKENSPQDKEKNQEDLSIKDHPVKFKLVPEFVNLGTRKVDPKEYMKMINNSKGDIVMESDGLFMKTYEDIDEIINNHNDKKGQVFEERKWDATQIEQSQATRL